MVCTFFLANIACTKSLLYLRHSADRFDHHLWTPTRESAGVLQTLELYALMHPQETLSDPVKHLSCTAFLTLRAVPGLPK